MTDTGTSRRLGNKIAMTLAIIGILGLQGGCAGMTRNEKQMWSLVGVAAAVVVAGVVLSEHGEPTVIGANDFYVQTMPNGDTWVRR